MRLINPIGLKQALAVSAILEDKKTIEQIIDEQPTIEPEQKTEKWIPCSERLPKYEEEVIVSVRDDSGDTTFDYSSCGWYACAGDFWVVDNEPNYYVIAWMPLPEPYREDI